MLGKLLKYDLKWIYKVVIVFYILAIIFAIIGRGLTSIENSLIFNILGKVSVGIAISMMVSSLINNIMRAWARFIKNIYKDESYLTHTLPTEQKTIYLSKGLSAIITMLTTTLVILVSLAICYYTKQNIETLKNMLELVATTYNSTIIGLLLTIFGVFFLEMVFVLLVGYTGIILGHKFNNGKIVKSIGIGIILYLITQIITLSLIFILGLFNTDVMNLFKTTNEIGIETIKNVMYVGIGIYIIYIMVYYIIGKKELEKGVDVD